MKVIGPVKGFVPQIGVSLNFNEILEIQANRPPFLFMKRAAAVVEWKLAASEFQFLKSWDVFDVHFAQRPMVPATILLEMMMQTAALAPLLGLNKKPTRGAGIKPLVYLTQVLNSKIKMQVDPGDEVQTSTVITWMKGNFGKADSKVVKLGSGDMVANSQFQFYLDINLD